MNYPMTYTKDIVMKTTFEYLYVKVTTIAVNIVANGYIKKYKTAVRVIRLIRMAADAVL